MASLTVLSLGWGVQSFTLAAMAALGEIEKPDFTIHADTTHESILTYQFAKRWKDWLWDRGIMVYAFEPSRSTDVVLPSRRGGKIVIPAYSDTPGAGGMIRRQCTGHWKRETIRRWISRELERKNIKKKPGIIDLWLGISWDEIQRMKDSDVKYITHRWPLIEKRMTRRDCVEWLEAHGLEVPPKSACTFCPYHNTAEWRRIKATPEDWAEAVAVDNAIRKARPPYDLFVHPSRKPLEVVDLRTPEEKGQMSLWDADQWDNECSGICGV